MWILSNSKESQNLYLKSRDANLEPYRVVAYAQSLKTIRWRSHLTFHMTPNSYRNGLKLTSQAGNFDLEACFYITKSPFCSGPTKNWPYKQVDLTSMDHTSGLHCIRLFHHLAQPLLPNLPSGSAQTVDKTQARKCMSRWNSIESLKSCSRSCFIMRLTILRCDNAKRFIGLIGIWIF